MSAAECGSEASRVEQANEWAVWANKRTDERLAQYLHLGFWWIWPTVRMWFLVSTRPIKAAILISSLRPFPHLSFPCLLLLISSPPYLFPRLPLPPLLPTPLPLLRLFSLSGGNNNNNNNNNIKTGPDHRCCLCTVRALRATKKKKATKMIDNHTQKKFCSKLNFNLWLLRWMNYQKLYHG